MKFQFTKREKPIRNGKFIFDKIKLNFTKKEKPLQSREPGFAKNSLLHFYQENVRLLAGHREFTDHIKSTGAEDVEKVVDGLHNFFSGLANKFKRYSAGTAVFTKLFVFKFMEDWYKGSVGKIQTALTELPKGFQKFRELGPEWLDTKEGREWVYVLASLFGLFIGLNFVLNMGDSTENSESTNTTSNSYTANHCYSDSEESMGTDLKNTHDNESNSNIDAIVFQNENVAENGRINTEQNAERSDGGNETGMQALFGGFIEGSLQKKSVH